MLAATLLATSQMIAWTIDGHLPHTLATSPVILLLNSLLVCVNGVLVEVVLNYLGSELALVFSLVLSSHPFRNLRLFET